jgi:hypothetical protein
MRRLIAAVALVATALTLTNTYAASDPVKRCQAAGYGTALHVSQPDGTREWTCFSDPGGLARVHYKPLKEL